VGVSIYDEPISKFGENVPRPDGRLPTTGDMGEQLSAEIRELEQEIEARKDQRQKLEVTLAVIKELSIGR